MANQFSEENKRWVLANHCAGETVKCFTVRYNREFNENRSKDTLKHYLRRLGLVQESRKFTQSEDAWLAEHAPTLSVDETAVKFNARFKADRSAQVLKARCNRYLSTKHKHERTGGALPIGSETTTTQGFVFVKVGNNKNVGFYHNWKQKHRLVWEANHGKVPTGHTLVFLDRNRSNCAIENLYALNGKVLREMAKKNWFSTDAEITLTAIKWCELLYAIKGADHEVHR